MEAREERKIRYIIALRASKGGLNYSVFKNYRNNGHFFYAGRLIQYSTQDINGRMVFLYYEAKHAAVEETDYLRRVENKKYEDYTGIHMR